jgi:glycerophosphoryl diester phosphodiesterase
MIKVCAHRGVCADSVENTLEAFRAAITQKADSIELDVWLTKDNQLAVHHDKVCEGIDLEGSYFANLPDFIPSLNDVIITCSAMPLNVELKTSADTQIERLAIKAVEINSELNLIDTGAKILISSFDISVLQNIRKLSQEVRIGYLTAHTNWNASGLFKVIDDNNFQAVHPHYSLVTKEFMLTAKGNDLEVNVWTVNDREIAITLISLGVDSIITDDVKGIKSVIDSYSY